MRTHPAPSKIDSSHTLQDSSVRKNSASHSRGASDQVQETPSLIDILLEKSPQVQDPPKMLGMASRAVNIIKDHISDPPNYCASFHSSCQAIWIASSLGSFDALGSSSNPSSAITRSRRSVKRTVSGSTSGNFSNSAMPMSSELVQVRIPPRSSRFRGRGRAGPTCQAGCPRPPARSCGCTSGAPRRRRL